MQNGTGAVENQMVFLEDFKWVTRWSSSPTCGKSTQKQGPTETCTSRSQWRSQWQPKVEATPVWVWAHSAVKKEILLHAVTWRNPEDTNAKWNKPVTHK
jgi:hypothetical protein